MKSPIILSLGILFGLTSSAMAAGEFVYEGVLTDANDQAITSQSAVQVNIYNDSATCLLSMHAMQVTPDGKGYFTVVISDLNKINGGNVNVSSVSDIFKSSLGGCSSSSDIRKLELVVNGETLSPKISLRPVPAAYKAQKVGDIDASSVLFVGGQSSGTSLTSNDLSVIRNLITNVSKIVSSDGTVGTSVIAANTSYVTTSALSTTLGGYVTNSSLSTTLGGYVQSSALSSYATTASLGSYLTTATASTTYAKQTDVVSSLASSSAALGVSGSTGAVTLSFDPNQLADGAIPASKVAGGAVDGSNGNAGGISSVTGDAVISAVNNSGVIDLSFDPSGIVAGSIASTKINLANLSGVSSIQNIVSNLSISAGGVLALSASSGVTVPEPSLPNHAATKGYVDSRRIASFSEGSANATLRLTSSINNSVIRVQLGSSKISLQDDDMPLGGSVFIKNTQGGSVAVDAGDVSIDGSAVKCITLPSQGSIQLHKVSPGTVEILASHGGVTVDASSCP